MLKIVIFFLALTGVFAENETTTFAPLPANPQILITVQPITQTAIETSTLTTVIAATTTTNGPIAIVQPIVPMRSGPVGKLGIQRADVVGNVTETATQTLQDLVGHHDESPIMNATIPPVIPVVVQDKPIMNRLRRQFVGGGIGGLGMGGFGGVGGLGVGGLGTGGFVGGGVPLTTGFGGQTVISQPGFGLGMGGGLGGFGGGLGGLGGGAVVDTVTVEDQIIPGKK